MTTAETFGDILSLALAFYRNPARHRDSLRVRVAHGGDNFLLLQAAAGSNSVEQDLREAALFAIEQTFFAKGATHYQIMGLSLEATSEQIKAHHRLLMRIFHPDRSEARKAWVDAYAGRVNEAYNVLRHSKLRRTYDVELEGTQPQPSYSSHPWSPSDGESSFSGFSKLKARTQLEDYLLLMTGRLPQLVLGSAALVALVFVAWVYVADRPVSMVIQPQRDLTAGKMATVELNRIHSGDTVIAQTPKQALEPAANQELGPHERRDQRKREVESILTLTAQHGQSRLTGISESSEQAMPNPRPQPMASDSQEVDSKQLVWAPTERDLRKQEIQQLADRAKEKRPVGLAVEQRERTDLPAEQEKEQRLAESTVGPEREIQPPADQAEEKERVGLTAGQGKRIDLAANWEKEAPWAASAVEAKEETPPPASQADERLRARLTATPSLSSAGETEMQDPVVRQRQQPRVSMADLRSLVGRFVDAYNRGDLESFMALFDRDARANRLTGKPAIRKDYGQIFRTTERRNLVFSGIRWQTRRESAYGNGGFRLQVQSRDESGWKDYAGRIRFEVTRRNGGVLITGLYHNAR